jgi:hypothetical protein
MVIGGGDVDPTSAKNSPEKTHGSDKLGGESSRSRSKQIPEKDEGKAGPGGDRDKDLEYGSLGISIANCGRNRRKPFLWVALPAPSVPDFEMSTARARNAFRSASGASYVVFVFHDLMEV